MYTCVYSSGDWGFEKAPVKRQMGAPPACLHSALGICMVCAGPIKWGPVTTKEKALLKVNILPAHGFTDTLIYTVLYRVLHIQRVRWNFAKCKTTKNYFLLFIGIMELENLTTGFTPALCATNLYDCISQTVSCWWGQFNCPLPLWYLQQNANECH